MIVPQEIVSWLACLGIALWLVKLGREAIGVPNNIHVSNVSQRRDVKLINDPVSVGELESAKEQIWRKFDAVDGEIKGVRAEMHDMELRLVEAGEQRASKLHERINSVPMQVADLLERRKL